MLKISTQMLKFLVLPILILSLLTVSFALPQNFRNIRVEFPSGETGTVVSDGIARGENINYLINASNGQTMKLHLESSESNAVFTVYFRENGAKLPDAEEVTDWESTLPSSGDYVVSVSSTRGGADFSLSINIE